MDLYLRGASSIPQIRSTPLSCNKAGKLSFLNTPGEANPAQAGGECCKVWLRCPFWTLLSPAFSRVHLSTCMPDVSVPFLLSFCVSHLKELLMSPWLLNPKTMMPWGENQARAGNWAGAGNLDMAVKPVGCHQLCGRSQQKVSAVMYTTWKGNLGKKYTHSIIGSIILNVTNQRFRQLLLKSWHCNIDIFNKLLLTHFQNKAWNYASRKHLWNKSN